jgi:hypothetical protein
MERLATTMLRGGGSERRFIAPYNHFFTKRKNGGHTSFVVKIWYLLRLPQMPQHFPRFVLF